MRMPRPLTFLLALVLGASAAGLVACGGSDNPHLLSAGRADRIGQALDEVRAAVDDHNCQGAERALARLDDSLSSLPDDTDPQLRRKLTEGASALATQAGKECTETDTTPTTTETTPTTTQVTTATTETTTTPTTTETTTTTTPTTTTPTTTTPTTTEPGNGGATPTTP
jgi:hypothetical protein